MKTSRVDTLVFDLFGVLIAFDNERVYARLAAHCERPERALTQLNGLMARNDIVTGKRSLLEVHQELTNTHGLKLDFPAFEAAWLEPYHESMMGMRELIETLAPRRRLVLLSNIDGYYWPVVQESQPELRLFEALFLSFELGLAKPDAQIFQQVCRRTQTSPEQCYFIDDTLPNVEAAIAVGFCGHWFRGVNGLIADLAEFGLD